MGQAQRQETLADVAAREAAEAEAEAEALDTGPPPEEEAQEEGPTYSAPETTAKDRKVAGGVLGALKSADILGPERAIEGLLQVMDIVPSMTVPKEWPGDGNAEYCESELLETMAGILIKGCPKLTINAHDVIFLWRNKEKWTSGGKTVRGKAAKFPTRVAFLLEGRIAAVEINYHHFKAINPLQRILSLYHELRKLDAEGSIQPPDFAGFYDEFELFGARTFRENMELARVMEIGAQVTYQFQLPLWEDE